MSWLRGVSRRALTDKFSRQEVDVRGAKCSQSQEMDVWGP